MTDLERASFNIEEALDAEYLKHVDISTTLNKDDKAITTMFQNAWRLTSMKGKFFDEELNSFDDPKWRDSTKRGINVDDSDIISNSSDDMKLQLQKATHPQSKILKVSHVF